MRREELFVRPCLVGPGPGFYVLVFALVGACGTLGSEAAVDRDPPTSGVGPFRKLVAAEQRGVPPYVLEDRAGRFRDPAVLGGDGPAEVVLFVTGTSNGHDAIFRSRATDARSFFGTAAQAGRRPRLVLEATHPWEQGDVSAPSAVRAGGEWVLFYAAAGGIGRARSQDGLAFASEAAPVLAVPGATGPSVVQLAGGEWRMLYAKDGALFEAASADGAAFQTLPGGPLLAAAPPPSRALVPGERPPFDGLGVGDPCASLRTTVSGRLQFRVLYTGYSTDPETGSTVSAIGFAARWGTDGPLVRNATPVLAIGKGERAPALFEWTDPSQEGGALSMLYAGLDKADSGGTYSVIGAAIAPVDAKLPEPSEFPDSP